VTEQEVQTPEDWASALGEFFKNNPGPNIGHEKLKPSDNFWDQKDQERLLIKKIDNEANNLRSAITTAERITAIKSAPGWDAFVKAIEGMRDYRRIELELAAGDTASVRILQGRCRELAAILSLMHQTENNTQVLVSRLESLDAEKASYVREDGKVIPVGAVG
jgi:hypothetical protein